MSAIAGVYHISMDNHTREQGNSLMEALSQYPCDTAQAWQKDNVFLGCHNQWITPESIGERNPYYDAPSGRIITADAIIDNRNELFHLLQVKHDSRNSMTDCELILLAYEKWGEQSPAYLVGDFAFMIWDERKYRWFGARDFSGSRTLYYCQDLNRFAFCTTIKPLLAISDVKQQLNEHWLAEFLAISGMVDTVDSSLTPYKNVEQLPPSHSITLVNGQVSIRRYSLLTQMERLRYKTDDQYVEAFQEVFQEAVSSRLRTHRQIGAQLSGGLDSGSIVGFAAKALQKENKPLHTFSYVPTADFIDYTPKYMMTNEKPLIQSTVKYVGGIKDHYFDFQGRDPFSEMDSFLDTMEMPYKFFENSFWMKGMFEQAQEKDVGILLNGGRGNLSISWGPAISYYATLLKSLKWIKLMSEMRKYSLNIGSGRANVLSYVSREAFPIIEIIRPLHTPYQLPMLINSAFAKRTGVFHKLKEHGMDKIGWFASGNVFQQRRSHFEEVFHWNAGNTLSSKLSLRHSLWKRDPSNDIRVIRFCLSLPEEQYVQNGLDRALIRRATENLLPDNVRLNQQIRGVQGADWVHRMMPNWNTFADEIERMCKDSVLLEYVDGHVIRNALLTMREGASPDQAVSSHLRLLMRSLIVHRFLKRFH